jgi:hypothetical protein
MNNLSTDPPVQFRVILLKTLQLLRAGKVAWTVSRIWREIAVPATPTGSVLNFVIVGACRIADAPRRMLFRLVAPAFASNNTLVAYYDLAVEPVSFDFLWFLSAAEVMRKRLRLDNVHVAIVPGNLEGFREGSEELDAVLDKDSRLWRVRSILGASAELLPSVSGLTFCSSRQHARLLHYAAHHVYPARYRVMAPVAHSPVEVVDAVREGIEVGALRATRQSISYVKQWLDARAGGRKPVSITLREYGLTPSRNSNIEAWAEFACRIAKEGFFPVVVRDTDESLRSDDDRFDSVTIFREAPWNVSLRAALYELCHVNLGINSGTMSLCWLNNRTRSVSFKMVTPGAAGTSEAAFRVRGFEPGETPDLSNPFQKWVWEDDTCEVIEREFRTMCDALGTAWGHNVE